MSNITMRLNALRKLMQANKVDMYLVPSIDAHCSEYVPACFNRRPWISGFTGSAGEALITMEHAYLSTDGRYFLQAEKELDNNEYTLVKQTGFASALESWIVANGQGKILGVDPQVVGINRAGNLDKIMSDIGGKLKFTNTNLVDECRKQNGDKLALPDNSIFVLDTQYTGESFADKLARVRCEMQQHHADYLVLNLLDEIAWLFNLRGSDVQYNPLFISYVIVGVDSINLFTDATKVDNVVAAYLAQHEVTLFPYIEFGQRLASLRGTIWVDEKTASQFIYNQIDRHNEILCAPSPIIYKKACKNATEIAGSKVAHVKDAVALTKFFHWLETSWKKGVDEISCAEKLAACRAEQKNIMGASFNTISSFASNGAIIHYAVNPVSNKKIDDTNLYLLDSGGQYLEGTTDVTRVVHLGVPTEEQKRHYTLVLKGHLALGRAIFPQGTYGEHLDGLARQYLWSDYLNYRHGTGHGVGSFLCVHEGPQKISQAASNVALAPGMIVSNEPGVYLADKYGIRIENLCAVVECDNIAAKNSEYGPFYRFENLTLFPYCNKLIAFDLLSGEDKVQLAEYYAVIERTIMPLLDDKHKAWLEKALNLEKDMPRE